MHREVNPYKTPVTVTVSETTLILENTIGYERMFVEVLNQGTKALNGFKLMGQPGANANFYPLHANTSEFTTPAGSLIGASSDLTTLTANTAGWFELDVASYYAVKATATVAANTTSVACYGTKRTVV
jgi:hypothetical protein